MAQIVYPQPVASRQCPIRRPLECALVACMQVCESSPEYIPQGAGVLVNLNGQHALEAIDPALYERQDVVHERA